MYGGSFMRVLVIGTINTSVSTWLLKLSGTEISVTIFFALSLKSAEELLSEGSTFEKMLIATGSRSHIGVDIPEEFDWANKNLGRRLFELVDCDEQQLLGESPDLQPLTLSKNVMPLPVSHDALRLLDLTPRQIEVLELVNQGRSNKEIARELEVTEGTVKVHCKAIFRALGVDNRTQAAVMVASSGPTPAEV